ncbi:MAG: DUF899 domain-containing protein [Pseudomonadota bacterium]|nr:DUF899 domain-containing protein [Pseudomonadota bacterium]
MSVTGGAFAETKEQLVVHLTRRDVMLVAVSRAPLAKPKASRSAGAGP